MRAVLDIKGDDICLAVCADSQMEVQELHRLFDRERHADSLRLSLNVFDRITHDGKIVSVLFKNDHYITSDYIKMLGFEEFESDEFITARIKVYKERGGNRKYNGILLTRKCGSNIVKVYDGVTSFAAGNGLHIGFRAGKKKKRSIGTKIYKRAKTVRELQKILNACERTSDPIVS